MEFYKRSVRVTVDGLTVERLRVQFRVKKSLKKEPNTAEIQIYNLAESTRRNLAKKDAKVVLEAGYQNDIGQIFAGDARTVDHIRSGADWITKIQCGDGEKNYRFRQAALSFAPGATRAQVVSGLIAALELAPGNAVAQVSANVTAATRKFLHGYAVASNAAKALDDALKPLGLTWSIQDGEVQVLKPDNTRREVATLLSNKTGLIGSPEHGTPDKKGLPSILKAKCFIQAVLRPGSPVVFDSLNTKGNYRIETVSHSGDTSGNEWYSDLECRPL